MAIIKWENCSCFIQKQNFLIIHSFDEDSVGVKYVLLLLGRVSSPKDIVKLEYVSWNLRNFNFEIDSILNWESTINATNIISIALVTSIRTIT